MIFREQISFISLVTVLFAFPIAHLFCTLYAAQLKLN